GVRGVWKANRATRLIDDGVNLPTKRGQRAVPYPLITRLAECDVHRGRGQLGLLRELTHRNVETTPERSVEPVELARVLQALFLLGQKCVDPALQRRRA